MMLPSTALVASALTLLATAPAPAQAAFDLRALGHHANAALTHLSHLPEVVGLRQASGVISPTVTTEAELVGAKRSLWARYYGDSRGFSRRASSFSVCLSSPEARLTSRSFLTIFSAKPLIERRGTIPTGWTGIGCVTEGMSSRTLTGLSYIDNGLTPEKCMTTCLARGFSLAGVEWSDECVPRPISCLNQIISLILLPPRLFEGATAARVSRAAEAALPTRATSPARVTPARCAAAITSSTLTSTPPRPS